MITTNLTNMEKELFQVMGAAIAVIAFVLAFFLPEAVDVLVIISSMYLCTAGIIHAINTKS